MNTNLIIREPELYFDSIHHELNNFLRDTFLHPSFANHLNVKKNSIWRPAVEVKQTDKAYKIKVQLPGVNKDDIDIELDNDFMILTAEIEEEKEQKEEAEKNSRYHTCEFRYGKYKRTISFDEPIKVSEAHAEYKNGVLSINIPKLETHQSKSRKLEIL